MNRDISQDVHTLPVGDLVDHDGTGFACWCAPRVLMVCPGCEGEGVPPDTCWRCGGAGAVPCERPEAYDGAAPLHVIHNAADGRE